MRWLVDARMPAEAKQTLSAYGKWIEIATENLVYEAISGHPDIFFCPINDTLIVAPNLPQPIFDQLDEGKIGYKLGSKPAGKKYPQTAIYNAVATNGLFIHNHEITDETLLAEAESYLKIKVNQGYTRCNLLALPNDTYITSDKGIEKALRHVGKTALFIHPTQVKLSGFDHGFFGGACGISGIYFFICGSINNLKEKKELIQFVDLAGLEIVELYNGPVVDVGGILRAGGCEFRVKIGS